MKRYLFYSFSIHALVFGAFLIERKFTPVTPRVYYEVELVDPSNTTGSWEKTKTGFSRLFIEKSAYELFKEQNRDKGGDLPKLSDQAEIQKEQADDESRPAYMKKEFLFKNYVDQMGEAAMDPWFREVEKVVRIQKKFYDRNFITTVIVIINSTGKVVKVVVENSSGNTLMDIAVQNAFMGLDFPHPPKQLIDPDGFGRVKWVFEMYLDLDLTKKGKFHLYRTD